MIKSNALFAVWRHRRNVDERYCRHLVLIALSLICGISIKQPKLIKADPAIRMLYLETPANPTIQCVDIDELSKIAKANNLIVACDNTFATPYLQQPFKYAVDFVVHSTTKFLNGHGTAIGGVSIGKRY